ncbi:hypothetical protein WG954_19915 [Lacibacter sp. H375]|uniref:hypothetical protein n=1 Tax=Lacibacter sp. H375 TaxID=3133424 RepID=UPI0030C30920
MEIVLKLTIIVSLLVKIGTHMHLDLKHKRFKGFAPAHMQPIEYLFLYGESVEKEFQAEKKICNGSYVIAMGTIVFSLFYQWLS